MLPCSMLPTQWGRVSGVVKMFLLLRLSGMCVTVNSAQKWAAGEEAMVRARTRTVQHQHKPGLTKAGHWAVSVVPAPIRAPRCLGAPAVSRGGAHNWGV